MPRARLSPLKTVLGCLWGALLLAVLVLWWRSPLSFTEIPYYLEQRLSDFGVLRAALLYTVFYAIRPLILFPATLLTIASGLLFGPWLGVLLTIVGENASANFAFSLARWFGRKVVAAHETETLRRWDARLEANGIVAVLLMRLLMLPFDLVNFGCGLTAMRQRDFFIGTFVGILPTLIAFVLLGGVAASGVEHRLLIFGLSFSFLLLGFALARWLKLREKDAPDA